MPSDAIVLGAGIVGVSVALHLQARGRSVCLVDRRGPGEETSYGNAGLIERSSVVPYAFPRDLHVLLGYAANRRADVRYDPFYLPIVAPWLARYWWHSAPERLAESARALLPLIEASVTEHEPLAAAAGAASLIRPTGWMELYRTGRAFEQAAARARALAGHGLVSDVLGPPGVHEHEPALSDRIVGAVYWRDPKSVSDPGTLTRAYAKLFAARGGRIAVGEAASLAQHGAGWSVRTADGMEEAAAAVVALGPWSDTVFRPLGYRIPLGIKRGYHMHYAGPAQAPLGRSIVDIAGGYVLAPMARGIRLTTGIEFAAREAPANTIQLDRAERLAREIFPLGERIEPAPWLGRRPCLPDMRPVIGPAPRHPGLWFAFGHAHHGLTLGPATGRLLAEVMTGETPFADPSPFGAERFGR
ncbi:MAG TPA: FAD-binding oxidoreductase [Stellaceae bacterium]|nr:FAD-binding oxidoreductase [Stellaceae bacterium]